MNRKGILFVDDEPKFPQLFSPLFHKSDALQIGRRRFGRICHACRIEATVMLYYSEAASASVGCFPGGWLKPVRHSD